MDLSKPKGGLFAVIKVVAAVIEKDGEFLVCRRGAGGNCAFLWEFPGGKIEEDETPNDALIREIREELDIEIEPLSLFDEFSFSYPDKDIYFYFIRARIISGEIKLSVHSESMWIKPHDKAIFDFCPADVPVINRL